MEERHKRQLEKLRPRLVEDIVDVDTILDHLLSEQLPGLSIGSKLHEELRSKPRLPPRENVRNLLDVLPNLGSRAFRAFLQALRKTHNRHLADELDDSDMDAETQRRLAQTCCVRKFCDHLQDRYRKMSESVVPLLHLPGRGHLCSLDEIYFPLTYSRSSSQQCSPPVKSRRLEDLDVLLKRTDSDQDRGSSGPVTRCLLVANAGCGKTFTCKQILSLWARGEKFKRFVAVIFLPATDKKRRHARNWEELLGLNESNLAEDYERKVVMTYLKRYSEKVLFIVDNAEEGQELCEHVLLEDLLMNKTFKEASLIVTSRPGADEELFHKKLWYESGMYNSFTLFGFGEHLAEFLGKRLHSFGIPDPDYDNDKEHLMDKLAGKANLMEVVRESPFLAEVVTLLLREEKTKDLPESATLLCNQLLDNLLQRLCSPTALSQNHHLPDLPQDSVTVTDTCYQTRERLKLRLSHLALKSLVNETFEFSEEEVQACGVLKELMEKRSFSEVSDCGHPVRYRFRHDIWHCFMAALAVAKSDNPLAELEGWRRTRRESWSRRKDFWLFLAGLLAKEGKTSHLKDIFSLLRALSSSSADVTCWHTTLSTCQFTLFLMECLSEAYGQGVMSGSDDDGLTEAAEQIVGPERDLDFNNYHLSVREARFLPVTLAKLPNKSKPKLSLHNSGVNAEHCKLLMGYAGAVFQQLQTLDLGECTLGKGGLVLLHNAIGQGESQMESLDLHCCSLSADDGSILAQIFRACPKLKYLNLKNNELGRNGVCKMFSGSSPRPLRVRLHKLRKLNLGKNNLAGGGVEIKNALECMPSLSELDVSANGLADKDIAPVLREYASLLDHRRQFELCALKLQRNKLTKAIAHALHHLFQKCQIFRRSYPDLPNLQVLLHHNNIGIDDLEEIRRKLPSDSRDQVVYGCHYIVQNALKRHDYKSDICEHQQSTVSVDFSDINFDEKGICEVVTGLQANEYVKSLVLRRCSLSSCSTQILAKQASSLVALDLGGNNICAHGLKTLISGLNETTIAEQQLCFLRLSYNERLFEGDREEMRELVDLLIRHCQHLQYIGLSKTGLSDELVEVMMKCKESVRTDLVMLIIAENDLMNRSAEVIGTAVEAMAERNVLKPLQYIGLYDNKIDNEGARLLANRLCAAKCGKLEVWMKGNNASPDLYAFCQNMVDYDLHHNDPLELIRNYELGGKNHS